jgi:CRP/FNR family transcriptional regulator/CRP/FNR family cyclic AMP-dependent transcriptional regulator
MSEKITAAAELLKQVPLFNGLSPDHLRQLSEACRMRKLRADEALFYEGEPGETLFLVVSGQVKIQRVTPSGKLVVLAVRGPGEHVGEMALLDGEPRSADAVTVEPCVLLLLARDRFQSCMAEHPQIALNLLASLTRRLREAANQTEGFRELDVLGRVAAALLELADSHGEASAAGVRITLRVTQQELADRIGATRVSVNKALGRLKSTRAIRTEAGALVVADASKLRRLCAD